MDELTFLEFEQALYIEIGLTDKDGRRAGKRNDIARLKEYNKRFQSMAEDPDFPVQYPAMLELLGLYFNCKGQGVSGRTIEAAMRKVTSPKKKDARKSSDTNGIPHGTFEAIDILMTGKAESFQTFCSEQRQLTPSLLYRCRQACIYLVGRRGISGDEMLARPSKSGGTPLDKFKRAVFSKSAEESLKERFRSKARASVLGQLPADLEEEFSTKIPMVGQLLLDNVANTLPLLFRRVQNEILPEEQMKVFNHCIGLAFSFERWLHDVDIFLEHDKQSQFAKADSANSGKSRLSKGTV